MTQIEILTLLGSVFIAPHLNSALSVIIGALYLVASLLLRFL